jgi:hypothetical protein
MVTDAVWSDLDQDNYPDLIVVGEWSTITVVKNEGGKMTLRGLIRNTQGWWNAIAKSDLDGDGDQDFVLGNWGLNSKWQASPERPMRMHVSDFDKNQKSEFIIEWFPPDDDRPYPFASKNDLTQQLPTLKKRILKYEDYALRDYQSLFDQEVRETARSFEVNELRSSILWNDGDSLRLQPLPKEAQIAPVYAITQSWANTHKVAAC